MNAITLCIVNDGTTYSQCLRVAHDTVPTARARAWANLAANKANMLLRRFDHVSTVADILEAASQLESHYAEHIKELA